MKYLIFLFFVIDDNIFKVFFRKYFIYIIIHHFLIRDFKKDDLNKDYILLFLSIVLSLFILKNK